MSIEKPETKVPSVQKALDLIFDNYLVIPNVTELANLLGCHRSTVTEQFKFDGLESPRHYLVELRANHAKELVVNTDMTVAEIAKELGYKCASSFSGWYVIRFGAKPLRHRGHLRSTLKTITFKSIKSVVSHLKEHIDSNFKTIVDVNTLFGIYPYLPTAIKKNFKQLTGRTPSLYLERVKFDYYAEQIRIHGWRGKDLVAISGYANVRSLNRRFRTYYGMSVNEYGKHNTLGVELKINGQIRWMTDHMMDEILTHMCEDILTTKQSLGEIRDFYDSQQQRWSDSFLTKTGMNSRSAHTAISMELALYMLNNTNRSPKSICALTSTSQYRSWELTFRNHFGVLPDQVRTQPNKVVRLKESMQFASLAENTYLELAEFLDGELAA